MHILIHNY